MYAFVFSVSNTKYHILCSEHDSLTFPKLKFTPVLVSKFDPNCRSNNKFYYALVHVGFVGPSGIVNMEASQNSRSSITTTNDGMAIGIMEARDKANQGINIMYLHLVTCTLF